MTTKTTARVLADSISDRDHRLITTEVTLPRYLLSEFNTHRLFSRNSASSRAIPPEKQLLQILDDPFVPVHFYGRTRGMGQSEPLTGVDHLEAENQWLAARDDAIRHALILLTSPAFVSMHANPRDVIHHIAEAIAADEVPGGWLNVSKTTVNRLLELFKWQTIIVTSTEWENFFSLRAPNGYDIDPEFPAEPEIQRAALAMRAAMRANTPYDLASGEWHLPLVDTNEWVELGDLAIELFWPKVSAGRCARVSFDTHAKSEPLDDSIGRAAKLEVSGHMSPFEHVATPFTDKEWEARDAMAATAAIAEAEDLVDLRTRNQLIESTQFLGNFRGWTQYRKLIPHEDLRRFHLEGREPWDHAGLPEHQPVLGGEV